MLKQKQTFFASILGQPYEFRHDPAVSNNLWVVRRHDQPEGELLDERPVLFPQRRMTHRQMVAWYTEQLIFDRAEAARRADERAFSEGY